MDDPLDRDYLTWLYSQVSSVKLKTPSRTYWSLLKILFTTEFTWFIPNDDNRLVEGTDLREAFLDERGITNPDPSWMEMECSMLEMLIALSRRLSFEAEGEPRTWFWHLLENLDLHQFNDQNYSPLYEKGIRDALAQVNNRTYSPNGEGGLFPLKRPRSDQRREEIWYQLNAYLNERL